MNSARRDLLGNNPDMLAWMGRVVDVGSSGKLQLESLIKALPAAIYTTDAEGHITFYNEAAAELWGRRPELGKSKFCGAWKLYWSDGRPLPHDACPMALVLKGAQVIRGLEAVVERPDGTLIHVAPYPTPLFDDSGTLIGAVNIVVDISDANAPTQVRGGWHRSSNHQTKRLSARVSTALSQVGIGVPSGCSAIQPKKSNRSRSSFPRIA